MAWTKIITTADDATYSNGSIDAGDLPNHSGGLITSGSVGASYVATLNQSTTGNAATATKISSITNSNIVQLASTQTLTNKTIADSGGNPIFAFSYNVTDAIEIGDLDGNEEGPVIITYGAEPVITINSNVGINDTTPSYKLDVNGTFRSTGIAYLNNDVQIGGALSGVDIGDLDNVTVSDSAAGGSPATGDIWIEY